MSNVHLKRLVVLFVSWGVVCCCISIEGFQAKAFAQARRGATMATGTAAPRSKTASGRTLEGGVGGIVCLCGADVDNNTVCWRGGQCEDAITCSSNAECGPSERCVATTCCDDECCPPNWYCCGNGCCPSECCGDACCGSVLHTCCGDSCAILFADVNNCGACGNVCPPGFACCGGTCCDPDDCIGGVCED